MPGRESADTGDLARPEDYAAIHSLDKARLGIVETALIGLLVLGAPNLALNILNDFTLNKPGDFAAGLHLILKPGLFMYLGIVAIFLFRKALPLVLVSGLCVAMLMVVGMQSLLDLGFIGSGMLYFLIACALGALLFDGWRTLIPVVTSVLAIAVGGWLWVSGIKTFYFDPVVYATSLNTYAIRLITTLFFLAILVGSIRTMNRFLKDSVQEQNGMSRKLHRSYEEMEAKYRELVESRAALEASEGRYEVLVENTEDVVYSIDPRGVIVSLNRAFERKTGIGREVFLGRPFKDLIEGFPGYKPIEAAFEEILRSCETRSITIDYYKAEGDRMVRAVVTATLTPVLDREGDGVIAVTGTHHDITELVMGEERARAAAAALEQSLVEKLTLLREIHHRVKNNFQIIESLLALQAAKDPDGAMAEALRDPRARIQSMALVHERLYQSKNLASIDFAAYIRELVSELEASWSSGDVAVHIEAVPYELDIDRSILCGLVLNELVSNVFKHAFRGREGGDRRLRVTFGPEGTELTLSVEDNGSGLGSAAQDAEYRSLGMNLVDGLAGQLRGRITYSNGTGTRATLRFPLRQ